MNPTNLTCAFFKTLIESADLEKKIRMICRANENEFLKFMILVSSGSMLKIPKFSSFLGDDEKKLNLRTKLT